MFPWLPYPARLGHTGERIGGKDGCYGRSESKKKGSECRHEERDRSSSGISVESTQGADVGHGLKDKSGRRVRVK